jgi:hypothetical protein
MDRLPSAITTSHQLDGRVARRQDRLRPHTGTTASAAQLLNGISDGNRDGNTGTHQPKMVLVPGDPTASRTEALAILQTDLLTTVLDDLERERNEGRASSGEPSYWMVLEDLNPFRKRGLHISAVAWIRRGADTNILWQARCLTARSWLSCIDMDTPFS